MTSIVLPETLTTIGNGAFWGNELTSIVLPETLATIGKCAFKDNKLTSIVLPETLTTIGNCVFYGNKLTSIVLPETLTTIGENAFQNNRLTSIVLPDKFRTEDQVNYIFEFSLEELDNRNRKFVTPYMSKLLSECLPYHFHEIILEYITTSMEIVKEAMETKKI